MFHDQPLGDFPVPAPLLGHDQRDRKSAVERAYANPGGVPKHDIAKEIAQTIFLNNPEMIYKAYSKMLRKGNAYAFQVLSDRAFGKLKDRREVEVGPYREMSDDELRERIAQLERELGIPSSAPEALPPTSEPKPN